MVLIRDRTDWDGVVLGDPPRDSGIRYPSDDDEPMADTELQYHAITNAFFALEMHLRQVGRAGMVQEKCTLYYDNGLKRDRYAALGIPEYLQHDPHHRYLTEDLLGWQLRDGAYIPIPLQSDHSRGAWIGRSAVLDTDWGLDMATGRLRLWNPVQRRWYPTMREAGPAHEREAAQAGRKQHGPGAPSGHRDLRGGRPLRLCAHGQGAARTGDCTS